MSEENMARTTNVQRATERATASEPRAKNGARPGAEPAWTVADARRVDFARIEPGWPVLSADGEELGTVRGKGRNYLVVPYGQEHERTMFVPVEYIETVGGHRVILNQPSGLLLDMKLDAPPAGFPEEHERVGGVPHEPLRMEIESVPAIDPLSEGVAQRPLPQPSMPQPPRRDGGARSAAELRPPGLARVSEASPRAAFGDAALQPAQPQRDQSGAQARLEPTLDGATVSRAEGPDTGATAQQPSATHMDDASAEWRDANERVGLVNPEDRAEALFEERSGYHVLTGSPQFDHADGPTHQPGVKDPRSLEPLRAQFGVTGTPGDGQERNVTDLDLTRNKRPDGDPFGSQAQTIGRPLAPGEPHTAQRSLPDPAGSSLARIGVKDVPPGSVARPRPNR